ncbi:MAG TPA: YbaK/EbsC family protein [Patescibacteria group bacterium]|nr:YbaK/EbsC family protein [Patescibacteria group bacterium]
MTYHPVVSHIRHLLDSHHMWYEYFEHEPVRTSEEAASVRPEYTLNQGAKALILRLTSKQMEKSYVMLVFPADKKFHNKKVKKLLQTASLTFASEEEVLSLTEGIELGGVPPFGNLFHVPVIADPSLFNNTRIIFNAGDRRVSIAMNTSDYKILVNPTIVPLI